MYDRETLMAMKVGELHTIRAGLNLPGIQAEKKEAMVDRILLVSSQITKAEPDKRGEDAPVHPAPRAAAVSTSVEQALAALSEHVNAGLEVTVGDGFLRLVSPAGTAAIVTLRQPVRHILTAARAML